MTSEYRLQLLLIYGTIAVAAFFLSLITQKTEKLNKRIDNAFVFLCAALFIFVFGLRDEMVGTDTFRYVNYFENVTRSIGYFDLSAFYQGFGIGFFILTQLVHIFSSSYHLFLFIIAVLFIVPFVFSAYRFVPYNRFVLFFTFISCFFFYRFGINIINDAVSLMIFLVAISYEGKSRKMEWLYFSLSILIHYTSIILVLIWFFVKKVRSVALAVGVWFCFTLMSVIGIGLDYMLKNIQIPFIRAFIEFGGYGHYLSDPALAQQAGVSLNAILFNLVFLVYGFYIVKIKKQPDNFYAKVYLSFVYLNAIYMLAYNMGISERFGYFSWILIPLIVGIPIVKHKIITGKVVLWYIFSIALGAFSFFYILKF